MKIPVIHQIQIFLFISIFYIRIRSYKHSPNLVSPLCRLRCISNIAVDKMEKRSLSDKGGVYLIGSGPGDPDLLTIQAYRELQKADLVISDRLVSPDILKLIKCPIKIANKKPGCSEEAQEEIYKWVLEAVNQGKNVVRLKIGDPFLFGRGGEEILEYRKFGVEAKALPGLSSAYTAPLSANIPLTHRGVSNQVLICTGYGQNSSVLDLPFFQVDRTIVLLMAVGRLADICQTLLFQKGFPPNTPVCIIENATTPQERIIKASLDKIIDVSIAQRARAPAVIVIGDVIDTLYN